MKTSQIQGQIFIYILTIVLVSFILVYGYNAIKNIQNNAQQVSCLKFRNDLQSAIEIVSNDFGRVKKEDIEICQPYKRVCFVETYDFKNVVKSNPRNSDPSATLDEILKHNIKSETGKNVFLVDKVSKESFYAGNISINPGPTTFDVLCINAINNRISLKLEGKGNHVLLSEWK